MIATLGNSFRAWGLAALLWTFIVSSWIGVVAGARWNERTTGQRVEQAKRETYPQAWSAGFKAADDSIDSRGGMSVLRYERAVKWRER